MLIKFFLLIEAQMDEYLWSPIFLLRIRTIEENASRAAMVIFQLRNKIKYKHADGLYLYHWKTTLNESNAGHIRSFVWLPNVLSQLYTFSCARLKNCSLVFCSMLKTIFPFHVLSRATQDDQRIAMLLAPGNNRATFLTPVPWTIHSGYVMRNRWRNMVMKLRTDRGCEMLQ